MTAWNVVRTEVVLETARVTLFSLGLLTILCSALRTTLSTRGLPSSVLYAPTPRLIFSGLGSFLKASAVLKGVSALLAVGPYAMLTALSA